MIIKRVRAGRNRKLWAFNKYVGAAGGLIITPFGKSKKADSEKKPTKELISSLVLHSIVFLKKCGCNRAIFKTTCLTLDSTGYSTKKKRTQKLSKTDICEQTNLASFVSFSYFCDVYDIFK